MAKEANLDESIKGTVMSAFYWGYALSQVRPGTALHDLGAMSASHSIDQEDTHKGIMSQILFSLIVSPPCPPTTITLPHSLPQVPGGWAAQLYGGRITLIISFFLWSLVSMFTPTNARSTSAIMVARVAIGIAQGFIIPSVCTRGGGSLQEVRPSD